MGAHVQNLFNLQLVEKEKSVFDAGKN